MRHWTALVVGALLVLGGCSAIDDLTARRCPESRRLVRQGAADYVDFVRTGGVTYYNAGNLGASAGRSLRDRDLGAQVAVVRCKLAEHLPDPPQQLDGDAAFLDEGTALYAVNGYRPDFRLAARREGRLVLFEAASSARARTWADLLDLRGKVRAIGIGRPDGDAGQEVARIQGRRQVARLVDLLLGSPVGRRTSCGDGGSFLAFHLDDGTATVRSYHVHFGRLDCADPLPTEFRAAIGAALRG